MKKSLGVVDLTALGIAAIIGAGIFSTIGTAASSGGPAVSLLFVFTAIACGFSAMCYARFASSIPISGSAYTYAYASFGELIAWIIGWDLIMEYAVGNIAVAISWSDYFTSLLNGLGVHIPEFLTVDYVTASRGFTEAVSQMQSGHVLSSLPHYIQEAYHAWSNAPVLFDVKLIADIPAFCIVALIATLVYIGIYETKVAGNIMVLLKLVILLIIITVGAFYVNPDNWNPFAPNGFPGVMKGVAGVFFAYIGFDAISTTAEECRNPKRDLPRSMIYALVITTVLYVVISLVLTGLVHSSELNVGDPLAYAFQKLGLTQFSGFIALGAIIAMAGVLLVFQVGQPRIWMSMSRDGLLPPRFSKLHPKYKTPGFATVVNGFLVAIPALFMNLTEVTDLTSIGTLFAFVLVSGGVLVLDDKKSKNPLNGKFKIYFINSRYFLIPIWIAVALSLFFLNRKGFDSMLVFKNLSLESLPTLIFILVSIVVTVFAIIREWSLIPVLGLLTNLYLMSELGVTNWMRFLIWLVAGLLIYFFYSMSRSKLNKTEQLK
ncbi:MAG: amino acid permease [Bacteroidia bacterium]|nr:amino acid permease [Bacteroidia bacterium]